MCKWFTNELNYQCKICKKRYTSSIVAVACEAACTILEKQSNCKHEITKFDIVISDWTDKLSVIEYCVDCNYTLRDGRFQSEDQATMRKILDSLKK